jgi:hypothetical protein
MSRGYDMNIRIWGYNKERESEIQNAVSSIWRLSEWEPDPNFPKEMTAYGQDSLTGDETELEFASRVAAAAYLANASWCEVSVKATKLDEMPFEEVWFLKEDYEVILYNAEILKNGGRLE